MNDVEIEKLRAYIAGLSVTDKILLKRKLSGVSKCPDKIKHPKIVNELPEEIALREFKEGLEEVELSLIEQYQGLVNLARTARFNVGIRKGYL